MLFIDFVAYLEKLEKISSRLAITDLLAEMIKKLDPEETEDGVYLTLGQLGPDYDKTDFGMAVKMVLRAAAVCADKEVGVVEKEYKKRGDVGLLMEDISVEGSREKKLAVEDVYDRLIAIANDSGEGSQERKVLSLVELFRNISGVERKFVARIVLGKLRLGFSAKTIFDALSKIESGNKSLRKELDAVFQLFPDPGAITKVFKEKGVQGLRGIKVKTGVPVVPALCQRLNEYDEIIEKMGDVAVERKYDGTRVQIHFDRKRKLVKTYTRNLEESSEMFPELLNMGDWVDADQLILDCEAVGYDEKNNKVLPFQITITRKRKHGVEEAAKTVPLRFFLFDILSKDGESLIERPYFERRKVLGETIKKNKVLVADEYVRTEAPSEVQKYHDQYLKEGFEGAVIKTWDGTYLPGRQGWNWVKIKEAEGTTGKLVDTMDLSVMGYYLGRGKRAGFGIGAFLVGLRKGDGWVSVAKIGTGLSDDEFKDLRKRLDEVKAKSKPSDYNVSGALIPDVWTSPEIVVEVAADEITKSPSHAGGWALRFPRLVKFRDDKNADQTTTWEEFETIAKLSKP